MRTSILFTFSLLLFTCEAAVPLSWTVETSRAQPATFEAYQGETLAFEAALQSHGKPLEAPLNYSFFWQTNGMGNAYWEAPANVEAAPSPLEGRTNVLFATWLPAYDVGAKVYNCFIGSPSNIYHAAFQLRLRPSPGALPNALPLPTPVIDFARVRVLNPPWSGGGGGGVDTNAVRDIVRDVLATNGIRSVDGAARPLPKYLHLYEAADSYPAEAAEYYAYRQGDGAVPAPQCSAVRSGGYLYRNFDYPFDDRAEFVVHISSGPARFASVGVAQVGTNLTEQIVTSGKPEYSHLYKWLPGATVDGINENSVVAEINVVDGNPQTSGWHNDTGDLHPLAAVRWALDHATNAQHAAEYIASHIAFPAGWTQNFHYMVADERETWIVENGTATNGDEYHEPDEPVTMTNFQLSKFPWDGMGMERFGLLLSGGSITNAWYTRAYRRETNPPWVSDLKDVIAYTNEIFNAWASHPKEYFRNKATNGEPWWQTVHTSVYDITNRTLRVAVQETDDWYTFAIQSGSGAPPLDAYTRAETDAKFAEKVNYTDMATEWVAGAAYSKGQVVYVKVCVTDQKHLFVCVQDNEDIDVTLGDEEFWCPFDEYKFAAQGDIPTPTPTGLVWDEESGEVVTADGSKAIGAADIGAVADDLDYEDFRDRALKLDAGIVYLHNFDVGLGFLFYNGDYPFSIFGNDELRGLGGHLKGVWDYNGSEIATHADLPVISATDPTFTNAVLQTVVPALSTNITAEVYIAATNACANLGIDPALIPGEGTVGTVGGFIAMLFAVVFWMRKKIFDSSGKVTDDFATDLLGKPVANVKANTASLAAAYSETATYAVGDAVTYEGKLYKCAVAITTAEAWTPAHWTETTVATLWNNADTTSYGGQN